MIMTFKSALALLLVGSHLASALVRQRCLMFFGPVRVRRVTELTLLLTEAFVKGFWGDDLSAAQIKRLGDDVRNDLSTRYCSSDSKSAFLALSKGSGSGEEFIGFAGVELVPDLRKFLSMSEYDFNDKVLRQDESEWDPKQGTVAAAVLGNLVVSRAYRGRGHAKHLIRSVEAVARSWGERELWLSVEDGNEGAIAVYRKKGFDPISVRQSYAIRASSIQIKTVKVGELCMRKAVAPAALTPLTDGAPSFLYAMRNLV